MKWLKWLFGISREERTLICIRQEQTWQWPDYLGNKTEGVCEECGAAIYYEAQNKRFYKICNKCGEL